jgi:hypothetical protein
MSERMAILAATAIALSACAQEAQGEAQFPTGQCRRIALVDASTGEAVVGAEDLSLDPLMRRVIISAYDRREVERDAAKGASTLAEGGVYAVSLDDLAGEATSLTVSSIVSRDTVAGGLRPHGVAFDAARREITFVNRSYQKINGHWRMTPRIERAGADGAVLIGDGGAPRCSANDIALLDHRIFVSFDHAACGWRGGVEDLFASQASGIDMASGETVFEKARHANGVASLPDRHLALAATRDKSVLVLDEKADGFEMVRRIELPGAPDNVTVAEDGKIIAAVYPSLFAIGAQRKLGIGRSGSRIVEADPATGKTALLFDDPGGKVISAASVGLEAEGMLVIGSSVDRGIAVCKRSDKAS